MADEDTESVPRVRKALSAAEREALETGEDPAEIEKGRARVAAQFSDLEEWQLGAIPSDLAVPRGEEVVILLFRGEQCKGPVRDKGDRTCVLWPLSVKDERVARQRMFGDASRGMEEMSKAMIRAIDGHTVDPKDPQQIERFWDEIGPRYRSMVVGLYQRLHNFDDAERLLFLGKCVAIRTAH